MQLEWDEKKRLANIKKHGFEYPPEVLWALQQEPHEFEREERL